MEENSETSFFQVKQYKPMATGFEIWCMFLSILLLGKKTKMEKHDIEELMLLHVSLPYQEKRPWLQ